MAELQSTQMNTPFGAERVPVLDVQEPSAPGGSTVQQDGAFAPLSDATIAPQAGFGAGRIAREQRADRLDANFIESAGAAMHQWSTSRLVRRWMRPDFAGEEQINQIEYLDQVPLVLDDDERDYFMAVGKGVQSADYAMDQIRTNRVAREAVGDHEVAGLAASFADPMWLAVPPALRIGKVGGVAGRAASAVGSAGIAGAATGFGEGPVSDGELALSMLMAGAGGAAFFRNPVGKFTPRDPEFPQAQLDHAVSGVESTLKGEQKPHYKLNADGTFTEVPRLPVESNAEQMTKYVEDRLVEDSKARGLGSKLMWNMHKTMSGFGTAGKKVADLLLDNNSDLSLVSTEAHREAALNTLRTHLDGYNTVLRQQMADDGFGTLHQVFNSRKAYEHQLSIERTVQDELFRREQFARQGRPIQSDAVPKHITAMADALDGLHQQALKEMKAAGVKGAEDLIDRPGYLNRRWSSQHMDDQISKMEAMGLTRDQAVSKLHQLVGTAVRRGSGMDKDIANQVGQAIVDRALRRGYFEDVPFNAPAGEGQLKQMRDALKGYGLKPQQIERALDILRVESDEAGKAGILKHRIDLDYKATIRVGAQEIKIGDLIDGRVLNIVDQYAKQVSTQVAFARNGLTDPSAIDALRTELLHGISDKVQRAEAEQLFDNIIGHFRGEANGQSMNDNFRLMQAFNRTISLAGSGLWQTTEYANAAAEYGLLKTIKYGIQEIPGLKQVLREPSRQDANSLNNVLADWSSQNLRMKGYISRFEDGYDMDTSSGMQLSMQTMGQLVPMANGMKYIHGHQANIMGNLILDRLDLAAKGNKGAREALAKYGIESHVMDDIAAQIKQHGFMVDKWDDEVWMQVRPGLAKMMDAAVLSGRLGDVPAFAAFDSVGKFLFTYRSFMLVAHNKLFAGGLERNGLGAVGMLLLYQFPLTCAAVQAQSVLAGKGPLDQDKMVKKGIGQMGGIGMFSMPWQWATGEQNSFGAPGMIAIDRAIKTFSGLAQGDLHKAGSSALTLMPVASANPIFNAMVAQTKE